MVLTKSPLVEIFKGTGWEDCDAFIRNIRAAAWKESKLNDDLWVANYASLHLAGKALRWHSRLPPDVRRDWSKLEVALLDQWPSPDEIGSENSTQVPIVPTPAAAPNNSNSNANANMNQSPRRGVVKIISLKSNAIFYLGQPKSTGICSITKKIGDALHVSVDPNKNPHNLETSSWSQYSHAACITAWDIGVGGDIRPAWFEGDQSTLLDAFIDEDGLDITIAADAMTYNASFRDESRA
ncbi:hypothetical protein FRC00_008764, partial [Tulasnella sp. 408]